jgi:hypothetical protein
MIIHYNDHAASAVWLAAMLEMETEGERSPAQVNPHEVVMDERTPALLRRQAA